MKSIVLKYRKQGLSAVWINILPEKDGEVLEWARQHQVDWPALVGTSLPILTDLYGVTGAPETFVLNRKRRVLGWHVGYQPGDEDRIEAEVRLALGLEPYQD